MCTLSQAQFVCLADPTTSEEAGLQDICAEVLQFILTQLVQSSDHFGVSVEQKDTFLRALTKGLHKTRFE